MLSRSSKIILLVSVVFMVGLGIGLMCGKYFYGFQQSPQPPVSSNGTGQPTDPTQRTDLHDDIFLTAPLPQDVITSPLMITGEAKGTWYFEATFPVVLTNWNGLIIAEGYATATQDWMTEDFVPFTAEIVFEKPNYGERGSLILQKANASGLPEHDDALEITIMFE
jgi:hypothetical protein